MSNINYIFRALTIGIFLMLPIAVHAQFEHTPADCEESSTNEKASCHAWNKAIELCQPEQHDAVRFAGCVSALAKHPPTHRPNSAVQRPAASTNGDK
jgi:hypothetical protein